MIAVVGDFIRDVDLFFETVRPSPEGDWPIVRAVGVQERPGGAGAVVAMVRGLGEQVIGLGESAKSRCVKRRHFVDGRQVFREDIDFTHQIADSQAKELVEQIPSDALVLVADYGKGVITPAMWKTLIERHTQIIVDPSRSRSADFYRGALGFVPNRIEAGVDSISEATERCHELRQHFPRVCVKLDRDGMIVSSADGCGHIPATCLEPVDVCGCGDQVLAAIGVGLVHGMSWKNACVFANDLAGRKCMQHGATPLGAA